MSQEAKSLETKGMLADPGDHFRGRFEVERKFNVPDIEMVRHKLKAESAVPFAVGNEETDVFLDLPDGRLENNSQFQILRHMRPSERVLWISKGPEKDACVAMDLADFDKALSVLKSLGFIETSQLSKKRDIYFYGGLHLTLDKVEGLGSFVEIAAMTDDRSKLANLGLRIQSVIGELELDDFPEEHRSYRQMLFG